MSDSLEAGHSRKDSRGVQSIEVGGRLLAVLADNEQPMMLKLIAQQADVPPAQAHAYLLSYRRIGLVEQDDNGQYLLGPFALDLAVARMKRINPEQMASHAADELSERTGLSAAVVTWGAMGPVVVSMAEGHQQIHMNTRPGTIYSISGTVTGRVFAAYLPSALIAKTAQVQAVASVRKLIVGVVHPLPQSELQRIRSQGFATMKTYPVPGVAAISSPIFDDLGRIRLALTLISSESHLAADGILAYSDDLLRVSEALSQQLGYNGTTK